MFSCRDKFCPFDLTRRKRNTMKEIVREQMQELHLNHAKTEISSITNKYVDRRYSSFLDIPELPPALKEEFLQKETQCERHLNCVGFVPIVDKKYLCYIDPRSKMAKILRKRGISFFEEEKLFSVGEMKRLLRENLGDEEYKNQIVQGLYELFKFQKVRL